MSLPNGSFETPDVRSVGCYTDNPARTMRFAGPSQQWQGCRDRAVSNQTRYFAVQNGNECFLSGDRGFQRLGSSNDCRYTDGTHNMGGPWANFVYEVKSIPEGLPNATFEDSDFRAVGCYMDRPQRTMQFAANSDWKGCKDRALRDGYTFFGMQNGNECFLSNNHQFGYVGSSRDCIHTDGKHNLGGPWANFVYETKSGMPFAAYQDADVSAVGCYLEDGVQRNTMTQVGGTGAMNWPACKQQAQNQGQRYFALKQGGTCYTGNDQDYARVGPSKRCRQTDGAHNVGGEDSKFVYQRK